MKATFGVCGVIALALGSAWAQGSDLRVGFQFPAIEATNLVSGEPLTTEALRGKVVLVDFWATWCGPCIKKLPELRTLYGKYREQGLEILSISLDDEGEAAKGYATRNDMPWLHIAEGGGWSTPLARRFNIRAIPSLMLVARNGAYIGDVSRLGSSGLEAAIKKALDASAEEPLRQPSISELDKQATQALAEANKLHKAGQYAAALEAYDQIGVDYAGYEAARTAAMRATQLRSDASLARVIEEQTRALEARKLEAAKVVLTGDDLKKAQRWLKNGLRFAEQKNLTAARSQLQRVIETYPGTAEAAEAQVALDKLPK